MHYTLSTKNKNIKNLSYDLANLLLEKKTKPVFLCVGNNKFVDDSLGPLVGELLNKYYKINYPVIGNFTHPLYGSNLEEAIKKVQSKYFNRTLVVIDACVGDLQNLYNTSLNNFGLNINYAKNSKLVGDISIGCVTHINSISNLLLLASERKKYIFECANFIASSVYNALKIYENIPQKSAI